MSLLYNGRGEAVNLGTEEYKYAGKKWTVLGDSISANGSNRYHDRIAQNLGMTVTNLSAGGRMYTTDGTENISGSILVEQVPNIPTDTDFVTVMAGTNDALRAASLRLPNGEKTDTGFETLSGCVYETIKAILTANPSISVGVILPIPRCDSASSNACLVEVSETIKAVCEYYSIPCFDLTKHSGLLGLMNADTTAATYTDSGIHINETGHAIIARALEPWLKTLIPL